MPAFHSDLSPRAEPRRRVVEPFFAENCPDHLNPNTPCHLDNHKSRRRCSSGWMADYASAKTRPSIWIPAPRMGAHRWVLHFGNRRHSDRFMWNPSKCLRLWSAGGQAIPEGIYCDWPLSICPQSNVARCDSGDVRLEHGQPVADDARGMVWADCAHPSGCDLH